MTYTTVWYSWYEQRITHSISLRWLIDWLEHNFEMTPDAPLSILEVRTVDR